MRILPFLLVLAVLASPSLACNSIGGALPDPSLCPPEATEQWWLGRWATREVDRGRKLTAFTELMPRGLYRTTLVYDDGSKIEHAGHYTIRFTGDAQSFYKRRRLGSLAPDAAAIEDGVRRSGAIGNAIGGALPIPSETETNCLTGTIRYVIESHSPDVTFSSPQEFSFVTQGTGYLRVTGQGATAALARQYR